MKTMTKALVKSARKKTQRSQTQDTPAGGMKKVASFPL